MTAARRPIRTTVPDAHRIVGRRCLCFVSAGPRTPEIGFLFQFFESQLQVIHVPDALRRIFAETAPDDSIEFPGYPFHNLAYGLLLSRRIAATVEASGVTLGRPAAGSAFHTAANRS